MKNKYSTSAEQQTGEMPGKIMPPHFTCFLCTSLFISFYDVDVELCDGSDIFFTPEDFCGAI